MPSDTVPAPTRQVFSRKVIFVGVLLACAFLAVLRFGEMVLGPPPTSLPFDLHRIILNAKEPGCSALEQNMQSSPERRFRTAPGSAPDVFALRIDARHVPAVLVLDNNPDHVRLLSCGTDGQLLRLVEAGTAVAQSDKPLLSTLTALPISAAGAGATHLLWVENIAALPFGLSLLSEADFQRQDARKLLTHVGFISAIALMILYNLALALSSGIAAFFFNALSIAAILLLNLYRSGMGMTYFWPETPQLAPLMLVVALSGATAFAPFYLYRFIVPFGETLISARPLILVWPLSVVAALLSGLFLHLIWVTLIVVVLFNALVGVVTVQLAVQAYRGHETAAVFLTLALGALLPGVVAGGLRELAVVDFGALAPHLMELGLLFEAPAFTLVLAFLILKSRSREVEAEQALQRLSESSKRQLLDALDKDRTRLASDLHDSGGQMLGLILTRLKGLVQAIPADDARKTTLEEIAGLTQETLGELRRISHDLHPATLTHLGLKRAILAMCRDVTKAGALRVHCLQDYDEAALSAVQQLQVYRIFQEVISNAQRHSGATDATLEILSEKSCFTLQFSDNGSAQPLAASEVGLGRDILQQRVQRLGGTQRTSMGDFGTTVTIVFDAKATNHRSTK